MSQSFFVNVVLFDVFGKKIKTIIQQNFSVGTHSIEVTTNDLPSGEYFVTINTDFGFQTEKIVVFK